MRRHPCRRLGPALLALSAVLAAPAALKAQVRATRPSAEPASPAVAAFLRSLRADPLLAPYDIRAEARGRQVVLRGRVGSKGAHDRAIRAAIDAGLPVVDELVIDTSTARALGVVTPMTPAPPLLPPPYVGPFYPPGLVFDPLLLGPDSPFFGVDPPVVMYPPGFPALAARRSAEPSAVDPGAGGRGAPLVEIDPLGVARVRGTVGSLAEKVAVGQELARTPGVYEVINQLSVDPASALDPDPAAFPSTPRAAPAPAGPPERFVPPPPEPGPDAPPALIGPDDPVAVDPLAGRVHDAMARRPALAGRDVRVSGRDGTITLEGRVPTAYEAMLAFRVAERTPGVRAVVDRLAYEPLADGSPNPLLERGRPDDISAYVLAHLRELVGDKAHVDRVDVRGDMLTIVGTLADAADQAGVEALIRGAPLVRGFRVETRLSTPRD